MDIEAGAEGVPEVRQPAEGVQMVLTQNLHAG